MAHREKHRIEAQIKRAGEGRKIKSDIVPGFKRTTDEYKASKKVAAKRKKLMEGDE